MVLDLVTDDDLVADEGMRTAVILSIFPSARAAEDDVNPGGDSADPRGYWADEFAQVEGDRLGSKRWLLGRSKNLTTVPIDLKAYDEAALQWMIDDGVVATVEATVTVEGDQILEEVKLGREGLDDVTFRFDHVWSAEAARGTI